MKNRNDVIQEYDFFLINRLLQSSVASRACKYGIVSCLEQASNRFNEWRADPDNYM